MAKQIYEYLVYVAMRSRSDLVRRAYCKGAISFCIRSTSRVSYQLLIIIYRQFILANLFIMFHNLLRYTQVFIVAIKTANVSDWAKLLLLIIDAFETLTLCKLQYPVNFKTLCNIRHTVDFPISSHITSDSWVLELTNWEYEV